MNSRTLVAFADELEKIAVAMPGSFKSNVGMRIVQSFGSGLKSMAGGLGQMGKDIASAPGRTLSAAGDIATSPIQSLREGWKASLAGPKPNASALSQAGTHLNNAAMVAGTALPIGFALPKEDPMGRGESRVARGARAAVGVPLGIAGMKHGILPSMALGWGGDVAGGYAGRAIDRARGYKPKVKPLATAPSPTTPPRAALAQQVIT